MAELTDTERDALLEELASFTADDPAPFVSGRIVELNDDYFPEVWERTERGARTIAQRLMGYAGLDRYAADLVLDDGAIDEHAMLPQTEMDLAGIEGKGVHFTCTRLGSSDDAVLSLAHEVARAALLTRELGREDGPYRDGPRADLIAPPDDRSDAVEASVLAVHLGLGVLAAHGSHRYRQAGKLVGRMTVTEWQHVVYGGVSPESASYLLAVQLVVRAVPESSVDRLLAPLEPERRAQVRAEMGLLDRAVLVDALGLPPESTWAPAPGLPVPPLPAPRARAKKARKPKTETPVFRIRSDYASTYAFVGLLVGGISGCALNLNFLYADPVWWSLSPMWILTGGGWLLGRRKGNDECSGCERRLPDEATHCASCGGVVAGRIRNYAMRDAAAERWRADRAEERARAK